MMTTRCKQFLNREKELRDTFLPKPRLSLKYTRREQDLIRAYRLLVHAEIEAFIEERAEQTARRAVQLYRGRKATRALLGLFAFEDRQSKELPETLDPSEHKLLTRAHKALNRYGYVISQNNGIKEENLSALLLPIGCHEPDLDPLWVTEMNQFGAERGAV